MNDNYFNSPIIEPPRSGHTGGSGGGGYSYVTPSASSTTSAAPSNNMNKHPPADYTQDESCQYDPMADPYAPLDAVKLATALLFLSTATKSERAFYLFETYDIISEGYLCEKELRFLFANSFFLVANALPALFIPKERGQAVIKNQSRAMQARVKQETNSIVHKLIKNIIKKNTSGIFAFGSDSDADNIWFHQNSIQKNYNNSSQVLFKKMNSANRQKNILTNSTGGDQKQQEKETLEKLKQQQSEVRITRQQFIHFFKKSSKLSNFLQPQGLRDAVMPVIMSKGSFQMYKAAGDVVNINKKSNKQNFPYPPKRHTLLSNHHSSSKKVRFNDNNTAQPLDKKDFREKWHDSVVGNSSLVMGGVPLTSSMRKSQIYDDSNNNISGVHLSSLKQSRDVSQFTQSSNWSQRKGGERQRALSSVSFSSGKSSGSRANKVNVPAKIFIGEDLPPH